MHRLCRPSPAPRQRPGFGPLGEPNMQIDTKNINLKNAIAIVLLIAVVAVGGRMAYRWHALHSLAQDACDEMDGAPFLIVGQIVGSAVKKAERLGYTGFELGDEMRETCPGLMRALEERSAEIQARSEAQR